MTIKYGSKYDSTLGVVQIAACIRADIKTAVTTSQLPAAKYRVRSSKFANGRSINVIVSGLPYPVLNPERVKAEDNDPHGVSAFGIPWKSLAAAALEDALDRLIGAYNYDGSDSASDYYNVNFYGHVQLEYDDTRKRAAIRAGLFDALLADIEQAQR